MDDAEDIRRSPWVIIKFLYGEIIIGARDLVSLCPVVGVGKD